MKISKALKKNCVKLTYFKGGTEMESFEPYFPLYLFILIPLALCRVFYSEV